MSQPPVTPGPDGRPDLTKQPAPGYLPPPPTGPPAPAPHPDPSQQAWNSFAATGSNANAPQVQTSVPPIAWLVPLAAVLAVVGAFTPWFKPNADVRVPSGQIAHLSGDTLYSWKDGRIGLLAPVVLVVLAVGVVGLFRGSQGTRFHRGSGSPVVRAARGVLIAAVVSAACLVGAFFLIQTQYKIDVGNGKQSWSDARNYVSSRGGALTISHGTQLGFWLTAAAALLAFVAGLGMLLLKRETAIGAVPLAPPPPYGQPNQPYGQPNQPYGQPSQPYGQPNQPYGQPNQPS